MPPRLISPSLRDRPRKQGRRKNRQLGTAYPDRPTFFQSVCSRLPPRYHSHRNAKTERRSSLRNWDLSGLGAREESCPRGRWQSEIFELGSKQLNIITSSHSEKTQELITYNHPSDRLTAKTCAGKTLGSNYSTATVSSSGTLLFSAFADSSEESSLTKPGNSGGAVASASPHCSS